MKKELSGLNFNELYFNNFQMVLAQEDNGFVITEYGMNIYEESPGEPYSVIHTVNPRTNQQLTTMLYHKAIKGISLIIPQANGTWIAYETNRHELVILKVKKLS